MIDGYTEIIDGYEITFKKCKGGCELFKPLGEFHNHRTGKYGKRNKCKICHCAENVKYEQQNKEKVKIRKKLYRNLHKEEISKKDKKWYKQNKEKCKIRSRIYRETHRKEIAIYLKKYFIKNKKKILKYKNNYDKKRKKNDLCYRMIKILRSRIHNALREKRKCGSAIKDLGCSIEELLKHLELQFYDHPITGEKMTHDNYGKKWEIDHKEPLCSFNLEDKEQVLKAYHYTNLRPLWKEENRKKAAEDRKKSIKARNK